ncbi:DoxX family protein [Siphonobacter sp. SORGH_AS_0500]|uniref:DoxX family protein n=1 Tax=Siphonobacter sp. SORGH_AS_0500 TaxID=1864824 RepID=UPI002854E2EB|nr:DoxX family protein [Siphonobacter sp. SORGH_AS_0500]MDR6192972.1 hypothetical protein [Siphonobacter sp. SORGH_AS_0500]
MKKQSKLLKMSLWMVQILLAVTLIWAATTKWVQPINQLATMWPWTGDVSPEFVKLTACIDLLGGLGLIVPGLFQTKPQLIAFTAAGVVALMISAIVFHVTRGETSSVGFNAVFALLALFVAWGRYLKTT